MSGRDQAILGIALIAICEGFAAMVGQPWLAIPMLAFVFLALIVKVI